MTYNGVADSIPKADNDCTLCNTTVAKYCPGGTFAPMYAVTLNANGGTAGNITTIYRTQGNGWYYNTTDTSIGTKITTLTSAQLPTRPGYTFNGFTTSTGTQIIKNDGTIASGHDSGMGTIIYAQWTPNTYTIKYDANGGSGTMSNTTCTYGSDCTLRTNAFTKTGYTFAGWTYNGTSYSNGQTVKNLTSTNGGSVTFTAKWTANTYTIKYDANGGSGTMSNTTCTYGSNCTLRTNSFTKTGYTFAGWTYNGTSYSNGQTVSNLTSTNGAILTFTAKWTANTYTIKYDANGGSGTMSNTTCTYGSDCALRTNAFTKTGYTFAGWTYNGTSYSNGATVKNLSSTNGGSVTFTAKWTANTYTIKYDANGGSGTMSNTTCTYGSDCTLRTNTFTRTGYTFAGWTYNGTSYSNGQTVSNLTSSNGATLTFTAKWTANTYTCSAGQYLNITKCETCPAGSYCPGGTRTYDGATHLLRTCPTGYTSATGQDEQSDCYILTTAGKYVANANDSTQTTCAENNYCPGGTKVYYGSTGGMSACPDPNTHKPSSLPGTDYVFDDNRTAYAYWINVGLSDINRCAAVFGFTTNAGNVVYEGVRYDSSSGKYGMTTSSIYWTKVNPGYYLQTRYLDDYCSNTARSMLYRESVQCPAGSYCPGGSVPSCSSGTYNDTFGLYTCPTNSNSSAGASSCTCNTGYNYNSGTSVTTNACVANTYTLTYSANNGSGTMPDKTCTYGQDCIVDTNAFTRTGYSFAGWMCYGGNCNGGKQISSGTNFKNTETGNGVTLTIIPEWTVNKYTCATGKYLSGTSCVTCPSGSYCPGVTDQEYTGGVHGLNTCPANSSTRGLTGQEYCTCDDGYNNNGETTTMYSACVANTYTIKYDANGGSGTMQDTVCTYDSDCALRTNSFTKTGYNFVGWLYDGVTYQDANTVRNLTVTNGATITFVAQWAVNSISCSAGNYLDGNECKACPVDSYCTGGTWNYDGGVHGLNKCPDINEKYGAYSAGFLDVLAKTPHASINDCRATFSFVEKWYVDFVAGQDDSIVEQPDAGYDKKLNERGMIYVNCDYNSDTQEYDRNCTGIALMCGAGYVSRFDGTPYDAGDFENYLYYAISPQDAIENTCVPVGDGYWSPSAESCVSISDSDELNACIQDTVTQKNKCPNNLRTIGYGLGADEAGDCGRILHIDNSKVYLRSEKRTTPSLNVRVDGVVYYGDMAEYDVKMNIDSDRRLRVRYNDTLYWVHDDSVL